VENQAALSDKEILLQLYGLTENPFTGQFQREFATTEDIEKLLIQVDGFDQADASAFVEPSDERSLLILITGPSGSGRSSAARLVALKIAQKLEDSRKVQHPNESAPQGDLLQRYLMAYLMDDDHDLIPIRAVLNKYYQKVIRTVDLAKKDPAAYQDWRTASMQKEVKEADFYSNSFSSFNFYSVASLGTPIFCFENIRNIKQILTAADVFNHNSVLIFTTSIEPDLARRFRAQLDSGRFTGSVIELRELTPEDVSELIRQRWQRFGPGGRSLIPDQGIKKVFGFGFPIGGVVRILGLMLREHATEWLEKGRPDSPDEMSVELMWRCVVMTHPMVRLR
jgi:hypothetical protein